MGTEESKLRTLNSIASSLKDLVNVVAKLNENFVTFAERAREADVVQLTEASVSDKYVKNLAERYEGYAGGVDPDHNKFARPRNEFDEQLEGQPKTLGEAFRTPYKKEGE